MRLKNKSHKKTKSNISSVKETVKSYKNPVLRISLKFALLVLLLVIGIIYSDKKGYFNPDETNNHTLKKWNAYYDFTKRNDVDIILLGNSHLYTGINPKNLSTSLGVNAFILASPGTNIADSYFSLKEALKRSKPKIVVVETFGINNFNPHELTKMGLSDQFKSFSARKDFFSKVLSTPFLFTYHSFIYAWSKTIRNHDYIFRNTKQLKKNKSIISKGLKTNKKKLYLGRYVRFTSGIQDSLLTKYKIQGAPVDGNNYSYSSYADTYVSKIVKLCEANNIDLIFLTLPMYKEHIKDYLVWRDKIAEIFNKYSAKWINMQIPPLYNDYSPMCFENTYASNQHLTLQGSLIATYQLSNFIKKNFDNKIPNRKKEHKWHNVFYGEEGYFENNIPKADDPKNKIILTNKIIRNLNLREALLIPNEKQKLNLLIVKIPREQLKGIDIKKTRLKLAIRVIENGHEKVGLVVLPYDILHETIDNAIYEQSFKNIEIIDIEDAALEYVQN